MKKVSAASDLVTGFASSPTKVLQMAENPLFYRKSSFAQRADSLKNERRFTTDANVDYKIVVDQPALVGLKKQKDLLQLGYAFGQTGYNNEKTNAKGTIRVETKLCQLAYLNP